MNARDAMRQSAMYRNPPAAKKQAPIGRIHNAAKLNPGQVNDIRKAWADPKLSDLTNTERARYITDTLRLGPINPNTITDIVRGYSFAHVKPVVDVIPIEAPPTESRMTELAGKFGGTAKATPSAASQPLPPRIEAPRAEGSPADNAIRQAAGMPPHQQIPTATFLGWQPDGQGGGIALYNVVGGPLHRSTVGAATLKAHGIEIPPTPPMHKVK
jgi:hypothetical protein